MKMQKKDSAYKQAGVDIDAGAELVERIKPAIKKTHRSGVMSGLGGFGALFDLKETGYKDPVLVSGTDGVGTKIKVAIDMGVHDTIGIDAVAMCVNDIIVQGAEPLFFLDYFATGKLDVDVAEAVVKGIARGCEESGCALIGGETAEMPGVYAQEDYDIAGFAVGAVERDKMITGENIKAGDVMLGLHSSGLHSNGFSLVRKILADEKLGYDSIAPFDNRKSLGEFILTPTKLYVRSLLAVMKEHTIKGMIHVTGGGFFENVPRILPENCAARIDATQWELPKLFHWLGETANIAHDDMATTLNCGIGMIVICSPDEADAIGHILEDHGEEVSRIGFIEERTDAAVILENTESAWWSVK